MLPTFAEKSGIMGRYDRNRINVSPEQQERIRNYRVFIGGAGIGSLVAECALRLGFEHITVVDMDSVEESNLNRQNYTHRDIGLSKAEAMGDRLRAINPGAEIVVMDTEVTHDNVRGLTDGCDAAVNALDFTTDIPLELDDVCLDRGIPVLHPYNIGFSSCVMVLTPGSPTLRKLLPEGASPAGFEKRAVEHVIRHFDRIAEPKLYLDRILWKYEEEGGVLPPPQLSVASSMLAGMCTDILFRLATGSVVKTFPKFYFYSIADDVL